MSPWRYALLCLSLSFSGPTPAAPSTPPAASTAGTTAGTAVDATEAPADRDEAGGQGLMDALRRVASGQPVVAVEVGPNGAALPDGAIRAGDRLLAKLQAVADAASSDGHALIPYSVRGTWVLAPETRDEPNPDLDHLTLDMVKPRGAILDDLFQSLTPEQVRGVGSAAGLRGADLTAEQKALLARALRPPLSVMEPSAPQDAADAGGTASGANASATDATGSKEDGGSDQGTAEPAGSDANTPQPDGPRTSVEEADHLVAKVTAPLDIDSLRFSAHLATSSLVFRTEDKGMVFLSNTAASPRRYVDTLSTDDSSGPLGADIPAFVPVPNRYKPSDLDGKAYTAPAGLSGVHPLSEVLAQLSRVTGLKLAAAAPYRQLPVFLGSARTPSGDVLDALRLALSAAWRKMGETYILAWDRRGLAGVQEIISESTAGLTSALWKQTIGVSDEPWRRALAMALPFSPDDPLALTDEQRKRLAELPAQDDSAQDGHLPFERDGIPFTDLTPAQQDAIRAMAAHATVRVFSNEQMSRRPITEDDLRRLRIQPDMAIILTLDLPGIGPTYIATEGGSVSLRRKAESEAVTAPAPTPWSIHAPVRALMVPALSPARLEDLAATMQRHGFNTLYYPAFTGGYATFPTDACPLHPSLRGADGLAAAVAAMKEIGVRVVATIDVLAWQDAGDRVHWLSGHPDWLDVDALGCPRLAWVEKHPDVAEAWRARNYVRAREPQVAARLMTLLSDLAARKGTAGVAFAEWSPRMMGMSPVGLSAPDLGYALPDRLAALASTGDDPVDAPSSFEEPSPSELSGLTSGETDTESGPETLDPRLDLLARLVRAAKQKRPDWTTSVLDEPNGLELRGSDALPGPPLPGPPLPRPPFPGAPVGAHLPQGDLPQPDLVVSNGGFNRPGDGALVTVPPAGSAARDALADPSDSTDPAAAADPVRADLEGRTMRPMAFGSNTTPARWSAVVVDLRFAPDRVAEVLHWIEPPKEAGAPKPAQAGERNGIGRTARGKP